ncbi:PREDICTED: GATA zinc finger domain-containing protein 14-like [Ceratosolen solmsi marchali]|uniref:GATA zinc finger domain-containing protein 14-like n=1 Tax=Ceratosolen solmsi marchali TaxID=326594 RepID=A0AAJ6YPM3_9HYME|nr:PREDICTED: GATA zinc finger domain-containing protein 14-like [Ceratosolen solmsi marchali]
MTANQRIIVQALVLSIYTILQCSGKTTNAQNESYKINLQGNKFNLRNKFSEITTILPANSHIFSAEDYDILQDAESLQRALSIVTYEPQKIDATKAQSISKNIDTFEKNAQPLYTTLLPIERKYYEVPRKQSVIQGHRKQEKEYGKVAASKLVEESLFPKRAYSKVREHPQQHETYHHQSASELPLPRYFTKSNQKPASSLLSSPSYFPLTDQTSPISSIGRHNNHSITSNYQDNKTNLIRIGTSNAEVDVPRLKKKQGNFKSHKSIQNENVYEIFQPTTLRTSGDKIPRPFSLPAKYNPLITEAIIYPTQLSSLRQNALTYPTTSARQNYPAPFTALAEHLAASSIAPWKNNVYPITSPKTESVTHSKNKLHNRQWTTPYLHGSRISDKTIAHPSIPLRRNPTFQNIVTDQTGNHSTISVEQSIPRSIQSTQQKPIVYSLRPEQITIRPTISLGSRQVIAESGIPLKQEQVDVYSTIPTKQKQVSTNLHNPRKQESTLTYQIIPRRRNIFPKNVSTDQTGIHSAAPIKRTFEYPNSKRKVIPEEQNIGYPTIVQPTYTSINRNQPEETKHNLSKKIDNDDKDYSSNDSYNDSTENSNSNDDDNDDESNNSNDHYNYSYNERYEEAIDDEPSKSSRSYKVREETAEQSEEEPMKIKSFSSHRQRNHKQINPEYNQNRAQDIDFQSSEPDSNYDQDRGQNSQHEISEAHQTNHSKEGDQDLIEEGNHQHKKHHTDVSHDEAEGHSDEDHENKHHVHGEKGNKGYKHFHEHDKGEKGYHDKEGHNHHYDEKEGKNKKHHEESGFHEEHEKGEEGEKKTAFKEKGDHKKGHSTKGEHVIHKKDEFDKKTEFFDEFHEGGDVDKDGGYHEQHQKKKGGHHKKGYYHKGAEKKEYGEKGKFDKGHHHREKKGHDEHEGLDQHYHHEEKFGKKGAHEDAKKWNNKKGNKR